MEAENRSLQTSILAAHDQVKVLQESERAAHASSDNWKAKALQVEKMLELSRQEFGTERAKLVAKVKALEHELEKDKAVSDSGHEERLVSFLTSFYSSPERCLTLNLILLLAGVCAQGTAQHQNVIRGRDKQSEGNAGHAEATTLLGVLSQHYLRGGQGFVGGTILPHALPVCVWMCECVDASM